MSAREWWSSGFFDMAMADVLFDASHMKAAGSEARDIARLAGLKKGAVLDAACGTGRHSLAFARRGFEAVGVDASEAYVREAAKAARREKLGKASFQKGELRDLYRFQGSFDLVLNLFTSFGYYKNEADNFEALRQMAAALRPGGKLVMELNPRESIARNFRPKDWQAVKNGYLMEKRSWAERGRRLDNEWILVIGGKLREIHWSLRLYTLDELKALFRRAGMKKIRCYGDFKGQPFQAGSHLVILGEKA